MGIIGAWKPIKLAAGATVVMLAEQPKGWPLEPTYMPTEDPVDVVDELLEQFVPAKWVTRQPPVMMWRCDLCGKWSHAKKKPKGHMVKVPFDPNAFFENINYVDCEGSFAAYGAVPASDLTEA